jgi:hypothetical protein
MAVSDYWRSARGFGRIATFFRGKPSQKFSAVRLRRATTGCPKKIAQVRPVISEKAISLSVMPTTRSVV